MALADASAAGSSNIQRKKGTRATGDLIFLPVDSGGTQGPLNTFVLEQLNTDVSVIPGSRELSRGYAVRESANRLLCFVVTVGQQDTATLLALNLQRALKDRQLMQAKHLWIPLMGTGTGGLSLKDSDDIITEAVTKARWCNAPDVQIDIVYPQDNSSSGSTPIPQSTEVKLAIQLAWKLNGERPRPGSSVTTSLLFFALVESQTTPTTLELHGDSPAGFLSAAVQSMAGEVRYKASWLKYFGIAHSQGSKILPSFNGSLSKNVQAMLDNAELRAVGQGHRSIEMDDLIQSMLSYRNGRYLSVLDSLGLSADQLLGAYRDAMAGAIATILLNDVASGTDRLGYATYANAITSFLRSPKTPSPLSISIQAPWGAGKSSLMQQIRENLDPRANRERYKQKLQDTVASLRHVTLKQALGYLDRKPDGAAQKSARSGRFLARFRKARAAGSLEQSTQETVDTIEGEQLWTVWFNAWKYETSEQVWSGLVDAIVSQISDRLPPERRELFLFRLQLARIDDGIVRRKIYDRILTIWWNAVRKWFILGIGAIAALAGANHFMTNAVLAHGWGLFIASSPAGTTALLAIYLFLTYWSSSEKTKGEPASFSLAPYLKVPDYDRSLGSIHHIHKDLLRVLSLTPRINSTSEQSPIVIPD